ncbi:hypothetical protein B484DRAFT_483180 [Ochromonadaceae sp. CCMP2298]|nr:hypothetical protein B484DRAFT_483180 [Ochromonadaceae sp. CCMP2298]
MERKITVVGSALMELEQLERAINGSSIDAPEILAKKVNKLMTSLAAIHEEGRAMDEFNMLQIPNDMFEALDTPDNNPELYQVKMMQQAEQQAADLRKKIASLDARTPQSLERDLQAPSTHPPSASGCCPLLAHPLPLLRCLNSSHNSVQVGQTPEQGQGQGQEPFGHMGGAALEDAGAYTGAGGGGALLGEVVFATFISHEVYAYAAPALLLNLRYLETAGYRIRLLSDETDDHHPSDKRWNKIRAGATALRGWAAPCAWLVLIDADLLFVNWDFDIQELLEAHPAAHLLLGRDSIDAANTGFMAVRNSHWSLRFLDRWWALRDEGGARCDQHVLNRLLRELIGDAAKGKREKKDEEGGTGVEGEVGAETRAEAEAWAREFGLGEAGRVAVVPAKAVNSLWPPIVHFSAADPVLHLMGETARTREAVMSWAARKMCGDRVLMALPAVPLLAQAVRAQPSRSDPPVGLEPEPHTVADTVLDTGTDPLPPGNVLRVTPALLREVKLTSLLGLWEERRDACAQGSRGQGQEPGLGSEQGPGLCSGADSECADTADASTNAGGVSGCDWALLREALGHLCDPDKQLQDGSHGQGSVSEGLPARCMRMSREAIALHRQALLCARRRGRERERDGQGERQRERERELLHTSEESALLFDLLRRTCEGGGGSANGGSSKDANGEAEAGKGAGAGTEIEDEGAQCSLAGSEALASLVQVEALIDLRLPSNRAYLHHKRGVVFGALSEHSQRAGRWVQSLDRELVAVGEFGDAAALTQPQESSFQGLLGDYAHSAARLAWTLLCLGRGREALEWGEVALQNLQVLLRSSANEERRLRKELRSVRSLCASICTSLQLWRERDAHLSEVQLLGD